MSASMRCFVVSAVALTAWAQTPQPEPPTGSLSGVVKDATTRAPLEGVSVRVGESTVETNIQGQFTIQKIEPGRQWVSVRDAGRAASGGVSVLVNPRQNVSGVEVFLKLGGTISGKVLDEERHPVAGAAVLLLEKRFEFGQMVYSPSLTAIADSHGDYRLAPVPAERGFLILAKKS
jgi:hypothetical protein